MSLYEAPDTQQVVVDRALVAIAMAERNGTSINVRMVAETILQQHPAAARSVSELSDMLARRANAIGLAVEFQSSEPIVGKAVMKT